MPYELVDEPQGIVEDEILRGLVDLACLVRWVRWAQGRIQELEATKRIQENRIVALQRQLAQAEVG